MSYDPNYWGTICELDDEPDDIREPYAWSAVGAVFASALIMLGVVAYFIA